MKPNKYNLVDPPTNPYYQAFQNNGMFGYDTNPNSRSDYSYNQIPNNYVSDYNMQIQRGKSLNELGSTVDVINPNGTIQSNQYPGGSIYDLGITRHSGVPQLSINTNPQMRATTPITKSRYFRGSNDNSNSRNPFAFFGKIFGRKDNEETSTNNKDKAYNRNVLFNTIASTLKNAPLTDSILGYFQKKRDTPDYSGLENYKRAAMQETPVQRYTPSHISGNLKYNPYDYTEQANKIQAQTAAAQNLAGRSAGGNMNMLMAHVNNLLSNTNKASGEAYMNAWKANEAQRMAVAQENRRADEFNANADNTAEAAYTNARNAQTSQDRQNKLNALQYYDQQKYARNAQYQRELDAKRDEMVSNLGTYGQNAFNANEANTDQSYNYWKDQFGRLHFISGINGARPVQQQESNVASNYNTELFNAAYDSATDEDKARMAKMNDSQKQAYLLELIKRNNQPKTA